METCGLNSYLTLYINKYYTEFCFHFPLLNYKKNLVQILGKGKLIHHENNAERKRKTQVKKFYLLHSKQITFVKNISYLPISIHTGS